MSEITISHPDSFNTGDIENPTITYEEYMKKKEDEENGAINQSSDNA